MTPRGYEQFTNMLGNVATQPGNLCLYSIVHLSGSVYSVGLCRLKSRARMYALLSSAF